MMLETVLFNLSVHCSADMWLKTESLTQTNKNKIGKTMII